MAAAALVNEKGADSSGPGAAPPLDGINSASKKQGCGDQTGQRQATKENGFNRSNGAWGFVAPFIIALDGPMLFPPPQCLDSIHHSYYPL